MYRPRWIKTVQRIKVGTFASAACGAKTEYAAVSKWGRLRAPPAADAASKKEWQQHGDRQARKRADGADAATGHSGADGQKPELNNVITEYAAVSKWS